VPGNVTGVTISGASHLHGVVAGIVVDRPVDGLEEFLGVHGTGTGGVTEPRVCAPTVAMR
jgi:hypothetical protein